MTSHSNERTLSRGDVVSLWLFVAAGVAIAMYTAVAGAIRIVELARNTDVQVPAIFNGTVGTAPIGPGGSSVEVELVSATLSVDALPEASVAAGILEASTAVVATVVVVTCLILLIRELIRGRIFSKRNTRLVMFSGIAWIIGHALVPFFGNMVANGAFARISDGSFNNVVMSIELQTLIVAAFLAAFLAAIFTVGDRLQRDQEGLI